MSKWEDTKKSIELTNHQLNTLACYILMTTKYRQGEREAWESLSKEVEENGEPVFKNAKSNAEYYEQLEVELNEIRAILDNA